MAPEERQRAGAAALHESPQPFVENLPGAVCRPTDQNHGTCTTTVAGMTRRHSTGALGRLPLFPSTDLGAL
jgi:hypothetical protein